MKVKITEQKKFILNEIIKLSGSVDSLFFAVHNYYDNTSADENQKNAEIKKSLISFLKSLVYNDKANPSSKSKGFLSSVSLQENPDNVIINEILRKYNSNHIVQGLQHETDTVPPLSLSTKDFLESEFSSDTLQSDEIATLWAKAIQWSNRATKGIESYVLKEFGDFNISRYDKAYNTLTRNLNMVNENFCYDPANSILTELNNEINADYDNSNSLKKLRTVPRLAIEDFIDCSELMKTNGKKAALDDYSDIFADENEYNKFSNTLLMATRDKKFGGLLKCEMDNFKDYLTYKFRLRRLYQAKSLALSEFVIANHKENVAECYVRADINKSSSARSSRDKIFGILLSQYSEPIEVHSSEAEINEMQERIKTIFNESIKFGCINYEFPFKTGLPHKLTKKTIDSIANLNFERSFAAKTFLCDSYNKSYKFKYLDTKVRGDSDPYVK